MKEKLIKEWFLETKFGKLAMISWGDPRHPGVLMVHGYRDTSATFLPLVWHLPDTHYYVSFDFPGHGKSDHVSTLLLFSQAFIPQVMMEIVNHLKWKSFTCLSHSIGFLMAILYHHVNPGRVRRMINIDPVYAVATFYIMIEEPPVYFKTFYEVYYDQLRNIKKNAERPYEEFVQQTMTDRGLSREQAEVTLSRSLTPVGNEMYRSSNQPMMHRLLFIPTYAETLHYILSYNIPPTLNFHGMRNGLTSERLDFGLRFMKFDNPGQKEVFVDANHDLHITHAEELIPHIIEFLKHDFYAKL